MNAILLKTLAGVLISASGTVVALRIFVPSIFVSKEVSGNADLHQQTESDNEQKNDKVDIFVTRQEISSKTTGKTIDYNNIKCQFQNVTDMVEEFECDVFKFTENTKLQVIEVLKDFEIKINNSNDIVNQYHKIKVNKEIWDKWVTEENKNKKIIIYQSGTVASELSLLFGVFNNKIQKTDGTQVEVFEDTNNKRFVFSRS